MLLVRVSDDFGMQAIPSASCSLSESWHSSDPNSYMRQLCTEGYYGPVCSLCANSGNVSYGRTGQLQCKQCRPPGVIILAYIASALLVLLWLTYTIHVTLAENEEAASGHNDPQKVSQLIRVGSVSNINKSCVVAYCFK